jgi:hypothetical protein
MTGRADQQIVVSLPRTARQRVMQAAEAEYMKLSAWCRRAIMRDLEKVEQQEQVLRKESDDRIAGSSG